MEEWKFLLQKDGDRSWLPLDSPDVEILEGRYRIVAQTGQPQVSVNIRICHLATEEDPPKRRIQKRSNRTNDMGLMVMIPYTQMQPGLWEFSCFSTDPMSDLLGDTLHHSVRLRVAALESEELDDWDMGPSDSYAADSYAVAALVKPSLQSVSAESLPELTEASAPAIAAPSAQQIADLNVEIAQALGLSIDRLVEMTDQISHQLIEEVFREFNLVATEDEGGQTAEMSSDADSWGPTSIAPTRMPLAISPPPDLDQPGVDASLLEIVLDQEMLVAGRGQPLVISGCIALKATVEVDSDRSLEAFPAWQEHLPAEECEIDPALGVELLSLQRRQIPTEIQLVLRDPQSSDLLFSDRLPCSATSLPIPFCFSWNLPAHLITHLVLGEVILCGLETGQLDCLAAESGLTEDLQPLKSVACSITVDPEALVEELQRVNASLAELSDAEESADLVAQLAARMFKERSHLDLSFLNLTATATTTAPPDPATSEPQSDPVPAMATAPSKLASKQVLPPKLYDPDPEQAGKRPLDLPVFLARARSSATMTATMEPELAQTDGSTQADYGEDSELNRSSLDAIAAPDADHFLLAESPFDEIVAPSADQAAVPQLPSNLDQSEIAATAYDLDLDLSREAAIATKPPSGEEAEFQALNLHDRFLNRLNALATDAELSALLKQNPLCPDESEVAAAEITASNNASVDAQTLDMGEVVVEDDLSWRDWAAQRASDRLKRMKGELNLASNPLLLLADESVPTPMLEIMTDEIVAGKPINLRIKLPDLLPRIYVKLWVNDRQTRSLLDGPRWIVDFLPNGLGELESATQITAPFGTTEIRLEAIAVEMQTQRESQKISLDRRVIPADVPAEFLGDFDF